MKTLQINARETRVEEKPSTKITGLWLTVVAAVCLIWLYPPASFSSNVDHTASITSSIETMSTMGAVDLSGFAVQPLPDSAAVQEPEVPAIDP